MARLLRSIDSRCAPKASARRRHGARRAAAAVDARVRALVGRRRGRARGLRARLVAQLGSVRRARLGAVSVRPRGDGVRRRERRHGGALRRRVRAADHEPPDPAAAARAELVWAIRPRARIGSGLSSVEAGLRLRYELRREVAPYVGLVRERRVGGTADFARAAGRDAGRYEFGRRHSPAILNRRRGRS